MSVHAWPLLLACGLHAAQALSGSLDLAADCRANGTRHRLGSALDANLRRIFAPDAAQRCSGHTWIAVTRLVPIPACVLTYKYHSYDDLLGSLRASCHLPNLSSPTFAVNWRGR